MSQTAPVQGIAQNFVTKDRISGGTVSAHATDAQGAFVEEAALRVTTGDDGRFQFEWPAGEEVTLVFSHDRYTDLQSVTVAVPEGGLVGAHQEIAFQAPTKLMYALLKKLLPAEVQDGTCQIVVTVTAQGKTLADDPQGEPGAAARLIPAAGAPFYTGMYKRGLLAKKTDIFERGLTHTTEDGGVFFFNVPVRAQAYELVAEKPGVTLTSCRIFARAGVLVNGAPPNGPIVIS